ncbi:MAG: TlpA family protein disulfide reductase, partial [Acidobacteria bacterium]|nr:TlpA family protein disulfide reductase [Acidobacteriota bacterium]
LMYRAALEIRPSGQAPAAGRKDPLADNVERLWKELGGTSAARALLTDRTKAQEAAESRWERPQKPLPAFTLSDLEGKTWKLASLEGKAVLINLWATWCGPCRSEHPEFQKLYDKLKDRSDITVISLSVDTDLGQIAPYMKENKYTFPVLPAYDFVNAYLPLIAIPQNWLLDPAGKLQWIQVGYDGDPKWQQMITAKLDELLKMRP